MRIQEAIKTSDAASQPNWLLCCLIFLSLAVHTVVVFRLSPLFKARTVQPIEIEMQNTQGIGSPAIPQPPMRDTASPPRINNANMAHIAPVPIPETNIHPTKALPASAPSNAKLPEKIKKPDILQEEIFQWSPPETDPPAPPIHRDAMAPQRFKPNVTKALKINRVSIPETASKGSETSSATYPAIPSKGQPEKPHVKETRVASWSGPKSRAVSEGAGEKQSGEYFGLVRARIEQMKRYPIAARKRGIEGQVLVKFIIGLDGALKGLNILKKSSYGILDRAALNAVKRAAPFPKPPAEQFRGPIPLQITIVFHMR